MQRMMRSAGLEECIGSLMMNLKNKNTLFFSLDSSKKVKNSIPIIKTVCKEILLQNVLLVFEQKFFHTKEMKSNSF